MSVAVVSAAVDRWRPSKRGVPFFLSFSLALYLFSRLALLAPVFVVAVTGPLVVQTQRREARRGRRAARRRGRPLSIVVGGGTVADFVARCLIVFGGEQGEGSCGRRSRSLLFVLLLPVVLLGWSGRNSRSIVAVVVASGRRRCRSSGSGSFERIDDEVVVRAPVGGLALLAALFLRGHGCCCRLVCRYWLDREREMGRKSFRERATSFSLSEREEVESGRDRGAPGVEKRRLGRHFFLGFAIEVFLEKETPSRNQRRWPRPLSLRRQRPRSLWRPPSASACAPTGSKQQREQQQQQREEETCRHRLR